MSNLPKIAENHQALLISCLSNGGSLVVSSTDFDKVKEDMEKGGKKTKSKAGSYLRMVQRVFQEPYKKMDGGKGKGKGKKSATESKNVDEDSEDGEEEVPGPVKKASVTKATVPDSDAEDVDEEITVPVMKNVSKNASASKRKAEVPLSDTEDEDFIPKVTIRTKRTRRNAGAGLK